MYRLLFLPFFALLFFSCDDSSDEVDPLFYQISEADNARCMEEILDGILKDTTEMELIKNHVYNPDIIFCGPIEVLRIMLNSSGQLMIGNESNSSDVFGKTYQFFMFNRSLTVSETNSSVMDPSSAGFNYPFYNRYYPKEIHRNIEQAQKELDKIKDLDGADPEVIEYYTSKVTEWEELKKAIEIMNAPSISQIAFTAHVRFTFIVSNPKSDEVLNEIALAFYQMRNYECMRYFKESYLSLYDRAQRRKRKIDLEKLEVLKILHPASIASNNLNERPKLELPKPTELIEPPIPQKL